MTYVMIALAIALVADAIRMRGRIAAIDVLAPTDAPATHQIIAAPGVDVDATTARAASAYARAHDIAILDLVPQDLSAIRAMSLVQLVDPPAYRRDRLGPGRTAGHAVAISDDVAQRAAPPPSDDPVAFVRLANRLKHYGAADLAIAPAEHARPLALSRRFEVLQAMLGPSTPLALAMLPILWGAIALGIWSAPMYGLAALASWQLQPAIALAFTKIHARDLVPVTLFRLPIELYLVVRTIVDRRHPAEAHRAGYERLIAGGTAQFFEPRRESCPMCDARELVVHLRNHDLLQHKPGIFTLERCRACSHVFQNPRLSIAGLDFYYKDFYDGLGESGMEFIFSFGTEPYLARARMVCDARPTPQRWLDVGTGHGHFCIAARAQLPDTHFDGLDLGDSIDEAKRRGWVETGYRGLFPELAPSLAGRYDAISMSHYLEHTLDPRVEIAAAHTALAADGCLLIEVPDPDFVLGRLLRRYWLPWFQPQHLHLLSVKNLERLLRERGFTPIEWHRGKAHQRVDFFFASWLLLDRLAPPRRLPWRWRGATASAWRALVWTIGSPLIIGALIVDNLVAGPVFSRARVSNTYRVVATKGASSDRRASRNASPTAT